MIARKRYRIGGGDLRHFGRASNGLLVVPAL